jgi:WD40 repeat protein
MDNYFTRRTLIIENEKDIYKVIYMGEGLVVVAFERGSFSVWNVHTGKHVRDLDGHVNEMYAMSGDKLAASLVDEPDRVEIWNMKTFESVKILREGSSEIECFAQVKPGLLAHSE